MRRPRAFRVVAVEALTADADKTFYSTCYDANAEQVIAWYAMRWSIEVTFHDSKQHLGFEEPQGWTRRSVERTAPLAMLLYSLIVLWFAREGHRSWRPMIVPGTLQRLIRRLPTCSARLAGSAYGNGFCHWPSAGQGPEKSNNYWKTRLTWPPKVQKSNSKSLTKWPRRRGQSHFAPRTAKLGHSRPFC